MNTIFKRTSIRKYTTEPVLAEQIEMLLKAGMAAPSAMDIRPWEFIVVQERENLNKIMKIHPYSAMLKEAPLAIIVCADIEKSAYKGFAEKKYWIQDCSAATQNIMLQAVEMDLGSVWLGTYPKNIYKTIAEIFNMPENIIPVTMIAIGHPDGEVQPKDKFDKNKIHYEGW
jgi:nitroreductase